MSVVKIILQPAMHWAARRAWNGKNKSQRISDGGQFTAADVSRILARGWENYDQLAPHLPHEPTLGNRQNMILAGITLACFQSLLVEGIERDYAVELIAKAAWQIYEKWGILPRWIARRQTREPAEQMRTMVRLFLRYPFNPPGYRFEASSTQDGIRVAMYRCPVADYLRAQDAADLCVGSWCALDFPLAAMWGGRLERSGTLAGGASYCDFNFIANRGEGTNGIVAS